MPLSTSQPHSLLECPVAMVTVLHPPSRCLKWGVAGEHADQMNM